VGSAAEVFAIGLAGLRKEEEMARRLLVAAFMVTIMASPALAKGGPSGGSPKGGGSSIAVNQANPYLGGSVTFTTAYPSGTKNPVVSLECYQNGVAVFGQVGWPAGSYLLGGIESDWMTNGGSAYCDADLQTYDKNGAASVLATTGFTAAGAAG
jgi:hypothetical protein